MSPRLDKTQQEDTTAAQDLRTVVDLVGDDVVVAVVVGHSGNEVAEQQGDDDVDAAHERRPKDLQNNLSGRFPIWNWGGWG